MIALSLLLFSLLNVGLTLAGKPKGFVELDVLTFDKIVGKTSDEIPMLVRFAKNSYNKVFQEFSENCGAETNLLPAKFDCIQSDESKAICARPEINVAESDLPVYAIVKNGKVTASFKSDPKEVEELKRFAVNNAQTYFALTGQIEEFVNLATKMHSAKSKEERTKIMNEANELATTMSAADPNKIADIKVYTTFLQKVVDSDGDLEAITAEEARIDKLAQSKDVTKTKKDIFQRRLNILSSFKPNNNNNNDNNKNEEL